MSDRLAELEIRVAFQDRAFQELNEVVTRQQLQIERIIKELEMLKTQLKTLAPSLVIDSAEETPPPHY